MSTRFTTTSATSTSESSTTFRTGFGPPTFLPACVKTLDSLLYCYFPGFFSTDERKKTGEWRDSSPHLSPTEADISPRRDDASECDKEGTVFGKRLEGDVTLSKRPPAHTWSVTKKTSERPPPHAASQNFLIFLPLFFPGNLHGGMPLSPSRTCSSHFANSYGTAVSQSSSLKIFHTAWEYLRAHPLPPSLVLRQRVCIHTSSSLASPTLLLYPFAIVIETSAQRSIAELRIEF